MRLTKVGKLVNKKVQERREENEVDEGDKGKIISIKPDDIYKNLETLQCVEDRMIYSFYTLFPAIDWIIYIWNLPQKQPLIGYQDIEDAYERLSKEFRVC